MTSSVVSAPLSTLTGVIERITFHSSESGYKYLRKINCVFRAKVD
jgi:exodeoxyribonuclease V alpha subunit